MASVIIPGPEGRLEGKYQQINNANGIALLLHPHPEFGGSMNNKPMISLFNLFVSKFIIISAISSFIIFNILSSFCS